MMTRWMSSVLEALRRIWRSLYWQISLVFLFVLITAAAGQYLTFWYSETQYDQLGDQILHWDSADELLAEIEPYLGPPLAEETIEQIFFRAGTLHPGVEAHLLDRSGKPLVSLVPPWSRVTVPVAPIEHFLTTRGYPAAPILGVSPNRLFADPALFSAARVSKGGDAAYLYVQLNGEQQKVVRTMMRESFAIQLSLIIIPLTVTASGLLGLLLFAGVTRRFSLLSTAVEKFERGDLSARIPAGGKDEISSLSRSFNRMADTISANIETLQSTDALRRELIANVSHDLRKPLTVMQASLDSIILRYHLETGDERMSQLERAQKNCLRLSLVLDELFELSKLNTIVKPNCAHIEIGEVISEVVSRFQPLAKSRSLRLSCESEQGLPTAPVDAALFDRLLSNLIDNAIRYTPEGGEISVTARAIGGKIRIAVRDTGVGIPANEIAHIFQRAYRSRSGREMNDSGSGLGLAIAHQIVELHGSSLEIESKEGDGSTFSFFL